MTSQANTLRHSDICQTQQVGQRELTVQQAMPPFGTGFEIACSGDTLLHGERKRKLIVIFTVRRQVGRLPLFL